MHPYALGASVGGAQRQRAQAVTVQRQGSDRAGEADARVQGAALRRHQPPCLHVCYAQQGFVQSMPGSGQPLLVQCWPYLI